VDRGTGVEGSPSQAGKLSEHLIAQSAQCVDPENENDAADSDARANNDNSV
jgi:hypothetical protein